MWALSSCLADLQPLICSPTSYLRGKTTLDFKIAALRLPDNKVHDDSNFEVKPEGLHHVSVQKGPCLRYEDFRVQFIAGHIRWPLRQGVTMLQVVSFRAGMCRSNRTCHSTGGLRGTTSTRERVLMWCWQLRDVHTKTPAPQVGVGHSRRRRLILPSDSTL